VILVSYAVTRESGSEGFGLFCVALRIPVWKPAFTDAAGSAVVSESNLFMIRTHRLKKLTEVAPELPKRFVNRPFRPHRSLFGPAMEEPEKLISRDAENGARLQIHNSPLSTRA
jgi:hypothetical protein